MNIVAQRGDSVYLVKDGTEFWILNENDMEMSGPLSQGEVTKFGYWQEYLGSKRRAELLIEESKQTKWTSTTDDS